MVNIKINQFIFLLTEKRSQVKCSTNGNSIIPCGPSHAIPSNDGHFHDGPSPHTLPVFNCVKIFFKKNMEEYFTFRLYVFPSLKRLKRKTSRDNFTDMPAHALNVLKSSAGYVVAFYDEDTTLLRGIYNASHQRVKIDLLTSKILKMLKKETQQCPVGRPITDKNYIIIPPGGPTSILFEK